MSKPIKRFSFLLLQEREHYVQDWLATCFPPNEPGNSGQQQEPRLKGCLRLCSKSVFFEPDDINIPIFMFPLNKVTTIAQVTELGISRFVIVGSLVVKMKKGGLDAPYVFDKNTSSWQFSLDYAPVQQFLQQAQSLLFLNSLAPQERDIILQNAAAQKEAQAQFDISRLQDFNDELLFNYPVAQVAPLCREPGRLVLSGDRLYFQPLHNLNNDNPVRFQPLNSIVAVARRRYSLQHTGLEIIFEDSNKLTRTAAHGGLPGVGTAFFTFQSVADRDDTLAKLISTVQSRAGMRTAIGSLLEKDGSWLDRVTAAWQAACISNYDYLMYLNLVAGRSHCDLAQWPVMPWVLKDYESSKLDLDDTAVFRDLSKPVGALNAERLALFRERYRQMSTDASSPAFLYGTHYSTPGYVLYWLVRAAPAHMLRLQNGRFDAADRLFNSLRESWCSVLTNHADVKELIPEFYALPSDFLLTRVDLNLGLRQNGVPVGNVELPPWSSDADDFIIKHRAALESRHVSANLHNWIDLIFGYKQQGEVALAADNVFHHLTYEGAVNLETIQDHFERLSMETQINEFGQAPQRLFTGPHPSGLVMDRRSLVDHNASILYSKILLRIMSQTASFESGMLECVSNTVLERSTDDVDVLEPKTDGRTASDSHVHDSTRSSGFFPTPSLESCLHEGNDFKGYLDEVTWSSTTETEWLNITNESSCRHFTSQQIKANKPQTLERIVEPQPWTDHREPVNTVLVSDENASESMTLYTASKGGFIKVYSLTEGFQIRAAKLGNLPISSLALARSKDAYPTVLAGSYDNCVWAYSVDYGRSLGKVRVHDDTVSCVRVCGNSRMVTASWDATVRIWTLDEGRGGWASAFASSSNTLAAAELEFAEHDSAIWSLDVDDRGCLVASGAEDGTVILWDCRTEGPVWTSKGLSGSAAAMRLSMDGKHLIVASSSGHMSALEVGMRGAVLSEKDLAVPLASCELLDTVALAGSANGQLHFWLWNSFTSSVGPSQAVPCSSRRDHSDAITSIAIGRRHGIPSTVATSSEDCTVQLYRVLSCCCDD